MFGNKALEVKVIFKKYLNQIFVLQNIKIIVFENCYEKTFSEN